MTWLRELLLLALTLPVIVWAAWTEDRRWRNL